MTDYAEPNLRNSAERIRTKQGMTWFPAFMMAAIVAMVVLALVAEARMTPEARAALFEVYSYM